MTLMPGKKSNVVAKKAKRKDQDGMSPEMEARFEKSFKRNEEALRRLAKL